MKNFKEINRTFTVKKTKISTNVRRLIFVCLTMLMMSSFVWADDYQRVTDLSQLSDGDQVILVNNAANGSASAYAMSTTQNSNNRGRTSVSISSGGVITLTGAHSVQILTLKINAAGKYGFHTGSGYLYKASGGNYLRTNTTNVTTAPASEFAWTPSIAPSGNTNKTVTLINVSATTYYLQYNGSGMFSSYTNTQGNCCIFKKTASCSADPTVGNPTIPTSFTLTSLTGAVSVNGSCNPGSNCSWTDMGLVWSDGTATTTPTTSNNKKVIDSSGSTTSFANNIQPSGSTTPTAWVVGHTYYVREYGKNGKAGATYHYSTNAASFTLRSITFNSNGGSSVGTIYCNSGGTATQPSNPTNGNYTFDGWYTDAGLTTPVNWSSTISENKTYYAKWSCSKHITVSWSAPSHGSIVVHQGNSADGPVLSSGAVLDNCEQAQIYVVCTPDDGYGVSSFSATNSQAHTGTTNILTFYTVNTTASSTITVTFAPMYTVTWMVNGSSYTTGGPTTQLSEGQHVTTLPTAPNPASYCGDKFVGWTDAAGGAYVYGTSNLYTTASGFPNATGNQIFYAVFADYAD